MKYSQMMATPTYRSVPSGSAVRIVVYRVDTGQQTVLGSTSGISPRDDFEVVPIEESGEDGVNEHAQGRHSGSANVQGYFRPEINDLLPSRDDFIGHEYTIMEVFGDNRVGENIPLNVFEGCKISDYSHQVGARGVVTFSLAFVYTNRHSGKQWMEQTGDPDFRA